MASTWPGTSETQPIQSVLAVFDTFEFLLGSWWLERSIEDHRSGIRGSFRGMATVYEQPAGPRTESQPRARYEEMGELSFGKSLGPARRVLDYFRLDHTTVRAAFPDGRPFIDLSFRSGAWHSHHLCGEDRHEIGVFVRSPDVIEERWRVRGPTTAYNALTMVRRRFLLEPHLASDSRDIGARPA